MIVEDKDLLHKLLEASRVDRRRHAAHSSAVLDSFGVVLKLLGVVVVVEGVDEPAQPDFALVVKINPAAAIGVLLDALAHLFFRLN